MLAEVACVVNIVLIVPPSSNPSIISLLSSGPPLAQFSGLYLSLYIDNYPMVVQLPVAHRLQLYTCSGPLSRVPECCSGG